MSSSGLYNSDISTKAHRQYYLLDPVVYNSSFVKTIFYVKIGVKCLFLGVLCSLLRRQSLSVLFRVCVCVCVCVCGTGSLCCLVSIVYHRTWF